MTDDKTKLSESLNRGLNPLNMPDYYRQYREDDPDNPDANEIRDPHAWDNPDRSRRERFTPDTIAQWALLVAGSILSLGLLLHFHPIIQPAYQSPISLGAFVLIASYLVVYLKGREDGMDAYREIDKWLDYSGDSIEIRPGEETGSTGNWKLFETIRNVSYGGFNSRKLQKRDLPYDAKKLRENDKDSGEEPAVDALNPTVTTAECDHLGRFLFTHSNGLDYADGMEQADRVAVHPRTLDEDAFDDFLRLVNELEHEVSRLADDVEMLRDHNESATNLREELQTPQLEEAVRLMNQLTSLASRHTSGESDQSTDNVPFNANATDFDFGDGDTTEATQ